MSEPIDASTLRVGLRVIAAAAMLAASQLSACVTIGSGLEGSDLQYQGGPAPSPGGNFNPVMGRPGASGGG